MTCSWGSEVCIDDENKIDSTTTASCYEAKLNLQVFVAEN